MEADQGPAYWLLLGARNNKSSRVLKKTRIENHGGFPRGEGSLFFKVYSILLPCERVHWQACRTGANVFRGTLIEEPDIRHCYE